ncbi:glycosyltransferase [Brevibacterium yomogidense]|uniref:glycosyltransferase n=1 Tax=Brevibacterium yomogidense TaxID=946573 RepID=UPI0018DFD53C
MKVSMVSEHASPLAALGGVDAGGQNVHVAALSSALAARGHCVTVFTRRDDAALDEIVDCDEGVRVVHITAGPAEHVPKDDLLPHMQELGGGIAAFWEAHPDLRPDVVHSHFWMSGIAARTALDTAGLTAVPLVHTFHALGTVKRRHQGVLDTSPLDRPVLEPRVGQESSHIIATCRDEVSELTAMGLSADDTTVVPCGVDLGLFGTGDEVEDTGGRRRIVCIGRLVSRKGMDLVVHALAQLVARGYDDVELHVVGGGSGQQDLDADPDAVRLRGLADELGVADRVHLRGQIPREQVPAVLRSAAMVACTPWYEPFGIVPLEAMACGVPVLASRVGGLQDTVVDGETGFHVPPHDPDAIAEAAARILDDPHLGAVMGRNGQERVRQQYSWSVVAAATEAVYERMLRRSTPDRRSDSLSSHFDGAVAALESLRRQSSTLHRWGHELAARLSSGQRLFTAGNGGSAAEAQHLSSELVGRFADDRPPFSALALHADSSAVTAISNDYGYEQVFARQLQAHAAPGDVVILLTTSGKSPNLLAVAKAAAERGVTVWALTGPSPNPLTRLCDDVVAIDAPAANVQEAHLMAVHALCRVFDAEVDRTSAPALAHLGPAPRMAPRGRVSSSRSVTVRHGETRRGEEVLP